MARYELRNLGAHATTVQLVLAVRPFQVNPPTQFLNATGGVSSIREISWDGQRVTVNGTRITIGRAISSKSNQPVIVAPGALSST